MATRAQDPWAEFQDAPAPVKGAAQAGKAVGPEAFAGPRGDGQEKWTPLGQQTSVAATGPIDAIDQAATNTARIGAKEYRVGEDGRVYFRMQDGTVKDFPIYALQDGERYAQEYRDTHGGEEPPLSADVLNKAEDVDAERARDVLPEGLDAFARGAALGLDDEIDAITGMALYGGSFADNLKRSRAIRDYDQQNHPWIRGAGTIAGALALPSRIGGGAFKLEGVARPAAMEALRVARAAGLGDAERIALAQKAAQGAVRNQLAKEGAIYGGAMGAAEGDTPGERLGGAVGGAAAGGAMGYATGAAAPILAKSHEANLGPSIARVPTEGQQIAQAAERQGVDVLPADVGGPNTRRATSVIAQTIAGGQPVIAAAQRVGEQVANRRDEIANTFGQIMRPEAAGQEAIAGAKAFINTSRNAARAFYAQAEKATQGFNVSPTKALETLDANIAELSQTPGGAEGLRTLQSIRNDLAAGKTTVGGIRAMRTALRDQFAASGLRGSDIERRVNQVVDAAAEDVTDSLNAAGKGEAARLFQRGDRAWKQRVETIDQVLKPIIGTRDAPKSGEQVIKTLTADLQRNNARAVKFLHTLPEAEQGTIRASIIGALGKANKGAQNAEGDAFSLATFLTNWNEIGESAKLAYFGAEARAALNDLAKVAVGSKAAAAYANRSNTGGVIGNLATGGIAFANLSAGIATIAGQYGLGRLLASPKFARWLARAPQSSLSPEAYLDRLSRIARAEPAIANEVLNLQQRLRDAFNGSAPARLAADEPVDEAPGIPAHNQQQEDEYPGEDLPQ